MSNSNHHKYTNKLIQEKSPYLLQHAHNPVDWYPWGGEAFARAVAEDKPIFLSIGYSTCHWCHVMERESFEDEEVARLLNRDYIAIKVDREERPDVDHIYMSFCQALTGSGGWPLTIIMTPERKPFYAGTYFPKRARMGYPGIIEILERISSTWEIDKKTLTESSDKIMGFMKDEFVEESRGELGMFVVEKAFKSFVKSFDQAYGGFGSAPKFPTPHNLSFLLRYWKDTGDKDGLKMVEKTLESMFRGGVYDHIGYGFSRYSTDRKWLVPHFEKMLYDNALIAIACLECYQATGKNQYAEIARQIFEYVLRDMTSPDGGFYSAEDADSEGEEGRFYVWRIDEIVEALGDTAAQQFCEYYDITPNGNFEGFNIPNLIKNNKGFGNMLRNPMEEYRKRLFDHREKRVHPYKDDKILTSWNGLMIAALSLGARILKKDEYKNAAERSVSFIQSKLRRADGRLLARYRDGESAFPAYLDDYAFLTWGLIELYEATFKSEYLKLALELKGDLDKYFRDDEGGYFIYGSDSEQLIARPKDIYDGATPSGNSVAAANLLRLARLTGKSEFEEEANRIFEFFGGKVASYPLGYSHLMIALLFALAKTKEIVIVGDMHSQDAEGMIEVLNKSFIPEAVFIMKNTKVPDPYISDIIPFIEEQHMINEKATAYVCENFACRAPITDIGDFKSVLAVKQ